VLCAAALISLELVTSLWFWMAVCLYLAAQLGIDRAKQGLVNTAKLADSATVFLLDQVLHVCTIIALAWFLIRPTWATLRSHLSWSTATGDRVLEAGIVYVAVIFAGGYLIRYLTHRQWMTRSFAVAVVFLEVRVIGGLGGWENLDVHANETIVWTCLAFSILSADLVLQWQQLGRSRPVVRRHRAVSHGGIGLR
jgi:hypothetical protein